MLACAGQAGGRGRERSLGSLKWVAALPSAKPRIHGRRRAGQRGERRGGYEEKGGGAGQLALPSLSIPSTERRWMARKRLRDPEEPAKPFPWPSLEDCARYELFARAPTRFNLEGKKVV